MKKLVAFLTALTLLGGLTACERNKTEVVPDPSPSVSVSPTPTPPPEPSPTPPTVDVALTYDPEELEPWQVAYIQLLEGELVQEGGRFTEEFLYEWPYYYLYDIDKNGVPELIVLYGGRYDGVIYTYDRGEVKALNENEQRDILYVKNGGLYTWPEGNGVLYVDSQFWDIYCRLYYMDGGQLKWKEVAAPEPKFHEDGHIEAEEYPTLQDLYPDSQYLNSYCALVTIPERGINFLPIVNYPTPPKADWIPLEQWEQEEKLVKDVIDGDGWFYCVSEYSGGVGWVTFEEYCQEEDATLSDTKWVDFNGDNVKDATVRFSNGDGLILSAQDGVVYGYALTNSLDYYAWTSKGRFVATAPADAVWSGYRVHFAKNQFYATYAQQENIFPREFWVSGPAYYVGLHVNADASFTGHAEGRTWLPNGEDGKWFGDFSGRFSAPEKVNAYTYSMKVESLKREQGKESDIDGIHYIPDDSYVIGLEDGEELLIYLPGAPIDELPEELIWTARTYMNLQEEDTVLPNYGIYNPKGHTFAEF